MQEDKRKQWSPIWHYGHTINITGDKNRAHEEFRAESGAVQMLLTTGFLISYCIVYSTNTAVTIKQNK